MKFVAKHRRDGVTYLASQNLHDLTVAVPQEPTEPFSSLDRVISHKVDPRHQWSPQLRVGQAQRPGRHRVHRKGPKQNAGQPFSTAIQSVMMISGLKSPQGIPAQSRGEWKDFQMKAWNIRDVDSTGRQRAQLVPVFTSEMALWRLAAWGLAVLVLLGWTCPRPSEAATHAPGDAPSHVMAEGLYAFQRGDFEQAAMRWQAAAHAYASMQQPQAQSNALTHLARAYEALGHDDRAIYSLQTALQLAEQVGDPRRAAMAFEQLGHLSLKAGRLAAAEQQLQAALNRAHDAGDVELTADILHTKGNLLVRQQRPREALEAYRGSAELAQQTGQFGMAARALIHAARVAAREPQMHTDLTWLTEAQHHLSQAPDSHDKAYDLLLMSRVYHELADATPHLILQAAEAAQDAVQMAQKLGDTRALSYAWGDLGHLYEAEQRYEDALHLTRRAVHAAQQAQIPESLYRWEWQTARLLWALGHLPAALDAYARALATVQSMRAALIQGAGGLDPSFRQALGQLYLQYADLLLQKATSLEQPAAASYPAYDYYLRQARATVEQFKTAELRDYFGDACVDAARSRTQTLDRVAADTGIIYPILLADRTEILVSLAAEIKRVRVPVAGPRVERLARTFHESSQSLVPQRYLHHAERLYDWLIRPIEADFKAAGVRTLVFVPDGALRLLPLAALYDGEQFLIQKYALAITPSLTLTDPRPLSRGTVEVLAAGMTEGTENFPPLPAVREELNSIHQLYGGTVLLNQAFSPRRLYQTVQEGAFSIVHIASHGKFTADASQSFLLTPHGKLTLSQLAETVGQLQFREQPLELLTLSACETAQGDDRAALGLAGVAIQAGARSALGTLWQVNDAATALLMRTFYQHLRTPGTSRARALQQAQLKLLETPNYASPVFWAPFLLINNWL